jgi:hypothetical protein
VRKQILNVVKMVGEYLVLYEWRDSGFSRKEKKKMI